MPHSTRLTTPIPRSYLCDPWLNAVGDPLAREAFLRMKLAADNLGRLPGDAGMLAGILFPGNAPSRSRMEKVLATLASGKLIFHYQVGRQWFVEIADTGATQRLVGNMSDSSEYPAPPEKMVDKWQLFTGRKRETVKNLNRSKRVHTGSNGSEQVQTGIAELSRVKSSQVELSRVELDSAKSADATVSSPSSANAPAGEERTYGAAIKNPTAATDLHILTAGHFDREIGLRGYAHADEFLSVVRGCFDDRRELPLGGRTEAIDLMGQVVNRCQRQGFKAPRGWIAGLSGLRRELKD